MYKTGHSFTYLLLKESVANEYDVINVSLAAFFFNGPGRPGQAQPFFFDDRPGPVCYAVGPARAIEKERTHCLLDQSVVNQAMESGGVVCRPVCVDTEGGHFEHYL